MQSIDVKYTRFTKDNSKIVFACHAGYDEDFKSLTDFFIWDTKAGKFADTGFENPVRGSHPLFQEYFSDYQSPWSDNPGIIGMSTLRNDILHHLTADDYDLPEDW